MSTRFYFYVPKDFFITGVVNTRFYQRLLDLLVRVKGLEIITMICDNVIIDDVIEKFGSDVLLDKVDDKHFEVTLKASSNGVKF